MSHDELREQRGARSMSRRRALSVLGGGAAAAVAAHPVYRMINPASNAVTMPVALNAVVTQRLQHEFDRIMARADVHHALMIVQSSDGTQRWTAAAGASRPGGVPVTMNTPVFLASVTKLYTAAVVLRLAERGRIGLDDPIAAHLPAGIVNGLHRLDGTDYTARITVRHLLGHTSGLADYFADRPRGAHSLNEELASEGDRAWTLIDVAERVRSELRPHFAPQPIGSARQLVRYSDTNYQLLGAIAEAGAGAPLHDVFQRELFEPLGLRDTYLYPHRRCRMAVEPASIWIGDAPRDLPLALGSFGADGGMVATLDPVALQLPSWPIEYGLGIMRFRLPAPLNGFRPMPALLGHTGSTGSWLFYCPELDMMLAGTVSQANAAALPYRLLPRLIRALQ
jgi:D-alanyl-D-alanine carboxypeptidase